jgi:MYXO-CTERM domain-containing protein
LTPFPTLGLALFGATTGGGPWWSTSPDPTFAALAGWSNKVELGDLDGDGDLDVIIANGGSYSSAGTPEPSVLLIPDGAASFTSLVLPELTGLHRVAKVRDFDGDGFADVFLGGAWQTKSVLLLGDGAGGFVDASDRLPTDPLSIGDAEPGDVDDDGDLDLVLADSGPGDAFTGTGAPTRLWRNDGTGTFTDDSLASMPPDRVAWSWDLELLDVDADFDLDLAISCKTCAIQFLFTNDGTGMFANVSDQMAPSSNNYDFEALDLDADGDLDLLGINDGPSLRETLRLGDGAGSFTDASAQLPGGQTWIDDNVAVLFDADDDGDADILVGSLTGQDRLYLNDGAGTFTLLEDVIAGPPSPGTLGMAVGDLNGDGKPDIVDVQGEAAFEDYLRLGDAVAADTHGPVVALVETIPDPLAQGMVVHAEVHDRSAPITPDTQRVEIEWTEGDESGIIPMHHSGHMVYRAVLLGMPGVEPGTWHVCATDRAGNQDCSPEVAYTVVADTTTTEPTTFPTTGSTDTSDTGAIVTPPEDRDEEEGCGCATGPGARGVAVLLALAFVRRTRREPRGGSSRAPTVHGSGRSTPGSLG